MGFTRFLKKRKGQHAGGKELARKGAWAREVIKSGGTVVLNVVHVFFSDDVLERGIVEAQWINHFRELFSDLVNDKGGGGGLANCSPERSQKIRSAALLRFKEPAAVEKNRQAILKYFATPGAKEKSRQAALRRYSKHSEIEKVSRIQKLRFSNPTEVEKNRRAILLVSAKKDLMNPPSEKREKGRIACLKWKAKQDAEKLGVLFDEEKWITQYHSLLSSVRSEALQIILDTF